MKKNHPVAVASALALLVAVPEAGAATQLGEHLSLSGFGTLGAVRTNSNEGQYGKDRQIGGADRKVNYDVDSNLGLQMTATATPWLSATAQLLAAKRKKNHIEAEVEWAFVTVKPMDGLALRGGRMAAPLFAVSDSRNVGFANTWMRAPNEVYALNLFSTMDAIDATQRWSFGSVALTASAFAGKTDFKVNGNDAKAKRLKGLNLLLDTEWATFRVGQAMTDISIPAVGVFNDRYTFSGFGVVVDRDNIVAQVEYVKRKSELAPASVNSKGWYVMGGYRFGAFTPYAFISDVTPQTTVFDGAQRTKALGLRWDAMSFAALKFQFDRVDTKGTKGVSFATAPTPPSAPGLPPGQASVTKPVNVFSVAVDFVF
jgi:hypothetical protein